ncbi:MAG: hypothetical protein ACOC22_01090 [bacterium]
MEKIETLVKENLDIVAVVSAMIIYIVAIIIVINNIRVWTLV